MARKQSVLVPAGMLVISLLLANKAARAQGGSVELMCRNKAKEIAFQTYNNCVTEEKTTRLKDLKERYKSRMSEVKGEFQRELDEINGTKSEGSAPAGKPTTQKAAKPAKAAKTAQQQRRAEKPAAGVATALPSKQNDNGPAQPIQSESDEMTVVTKTNADEIVEETEIIEMEN